MSDTGNPENEKVTKGYENDQLTQAQWNALPLVLAGRSDAEVAAAVGKSRKTVNLWRLHDPNFKRELARFREEVRARVRHRLESLGLRALDTYEELLEEEGGDARMRRALAKDLLELGLKWEARDQSSAARAAAGDASFGPMPHETPQEVALAWVDDIMEGWWQNKDPGPSTPELLPETEAPEEPSAAARPGPGGEAKVRKISKSLQTISREHSEQIPTLKPMMRVLEKYPEDIAILLEKAERVEQETPEPSAADPAASVAITEDNRDKPGRLPQEDRTDAGSS